MILAIETSTAACSVALFDAGGAVVAARDEMIGRGHAERLVPMIAEVVSGHLPSQILVGVGPGSFTGIRVGIAAAQGLAIGWDVELHGMSSLALLAAGAPAGGPLVAVINGGHGELFAQAFATDPLGEVSALFNATALDLAQRLAPAPGSATMRTVGNAAPDLAAAMGGLETLDLHPSASRALGLPAALRRLPPKPLYARAPDAKPAMPQPATPAAPLAVA